MSHVMIVEDDQDLGDFLAVGLRAFKHHVRRFPSTALALQDLTRRRYDLAVVDMSFQGDPRVAGSDGFAFLREVRIAEPGSALWSAHRMPIVVVIPAERPHCERRSTVKRVARSFGADVSLTRSQSIEGLLGAVQTMLLEGAYS
ncbi:MAG: hypothetical protein AAF626_10210 [Pseudomonadota bacterium]